MSKFMKRIDTYHKVYLNEKTNNEAEKAINDLIEALATVGVVVEPHKSGPDFIKITLPGSTKTVLAQVYGYSVGNTNVVSDDGVKGAVEEDEENAIDTNINNDKGVQMAQMNALQILQRKLSTAMNKPQAT